MTGRLSRAALAQRYAGRLVWARLRLHSDAVGACLGEGGFHTPHWERREATIRVCVRGQEEMKEKRSLSLAPAGRGEGRQPSGES